MEKRIKILNYLTVFVIVVFAIMQGEWLYTRYKYTVQTCADTLYNRTIESINEYNDMRQNAANDKIAVEYTTRQFIRDGSVIYLFDIYTADKSRYSSIDSLTADFFSRIYETKHPDWLSREAYVVVQAKKESEVFDAVERTCLDRRFPFSVDGLDTIMRANNIGFWIRNL